MSRHFVYVILCSEKTSILNQAYATHTRTENLDLVASNDIMTTTYLYALMWEKPWEAELTTKSSPC